MKEKLKKLLAIKNQRKTEITAAAEKSTDVVELRNLNTELTGLNDDIRSLTEMIAEMPDDVPAVPGAAPAVGGTPDLRTAAVNGLIPAVVASTAAAQLIAPEGRDADPYNTREYRNAFMKFACSGQITPELRADAMTTTSDISAIVPTTILKEVIKKVTTYGQIYAKVRKLTIKGGVSVPILSLKPSATWIGETTPSEKKKVAVNSNVTFNYYGLECKISTSLLADTVALEGFEAVIIDLIGEAMLHALELGIVSGDGNGKMLGITVDTRVPDAQIVTLSPADFQAWDAWKKKVFARMPLSYKAGANFLMASGTFEGYIDGMVDANGQPVGRVNYGITEGPQGRFGGKEVIEVEDDVIPPYDDATNGAVVAIYCNLTNYGVNSNMQLTMFRYMDHDTNEWVDKAILIADGKLIDPNGVVIIKKGA